MAIYVYIIQKISFIGDPGEYIKDVGDNIIEYPADSDIDSVIRGLVEEGDYYFAQLVYRNE